uniref:DDB1- and CUL4-associated factor 15 WD40 repeat-containing domain-containing protein n=1 Tax=Tetranychus urticae TaxID=32264 RepID=T1KMI2_TETUR
MISTLQDTHVGGLNALLAACLPFEVESRMYANYLLNQIMENENGGATTLKPLVNLLRESEINGSVKRSNISQALPRRYYPLGQIVPSNDVLSHIFLGFTRDGQYLLSYRFVADTMYFYIWYFNHHGPLKLVSEHVIFISSNNLTPLPQIEYLYESTAIHVYQWPRDDKHLLILTIPESHRPSVINLVCIHVNRKRSHILQPGLITLSG